MVIFGDIGNGVFVFVCWFLEYVIFWFVVCCMSMYGYFIGYNKCGVEVYVKLINELVIFCLIGFYWFEERFGVGFGNGV